MEEVSASPLEKCPHSTIHRDPRGCSQCIEARARVCIRGDDGQMYIDGIAQERRFVMPTARPRNVKKKRPDPADADP